MGTLRSLLPMALCWAAVAASSPAQAILREWTGIPPGGIASIHGGNDLFLDLTPMEVADGDSLSRTIRTGIPGNAAMLVVAPPGMAGYVVTCQAFATNARGKLARSDREVVTFR